jgi:hypothetical protein
MQIDGIPIKQVELSAMPIKESKTRLMFIMADGRRSPGEIFRQCRINDQEGNVLLENLITGGYLRLTGETPPGIPQDAPPIQQAAQFDEFAEILTNELANYVGPVAKMLVKRIDFQEGESSREQLNQIINDLALEIEEGLDRNTFVTTMRAKVP